ncbi:MAG: hypothetical protein O3A78_02610 [Nitrospinae bacterium]|jgi:hypothetical protein|nr:hypothetical protein [Nitrospinota bacterium]MDA1108698.1 hypothetical protein [Nitrospinota bacterium]
MNSKNWAENDIERGISYLADHEEQATTETIIHAGEDTTILLPSGLPVYGANITGIFMMAPLLLFIAILILFPIRILGSTHGLSSFTLVLGLCFLLLGWGLTKVIQLMLKNRDLFPRCYFVTLGLQGIAMHFTRLHFPFHAPRMAVRWKDIQTVRRNKILFLPALLFGIPRVTTLEVICSGGKKILIPFRLPREKSDALADKIELLIQQKIK